jgi:hypothetical protein
VSDNLNVFERIILRREAMKYFQSLFSHWSTYAGVFGAIIAFLTPSINAYIAAHPNATAGVLLAAVLAAYHASAPKDSDALKQIAAGAKSIALIVCSLVVLSIASRAQTSPAPLQNLYAAGVSWNQAGSPSIAGTALFAHLVNDGSGTYAFGVYDALPQNTKPFTVTSNVGAGIAQQIFKIGNTPVFIPTSAGISFSGPNTGWAWSTGVGVPIKFKSTSNWYAMPTVRVVKSSIANGTGYQLIPTIMIAWGK